ncbi:NAD(P)-dependent oxidoreductase [Nonomuraea spiralis]|uniref:NAD(P)-dependent oxidoreductase n=1 Tax=Nonomuraea spiralis TaxID=46182 RepID=A0ABV5I8K9_9ACTN|nr:SDR family oxidoreductase [Nonomuraea spiralis]GGS66021.1 NADH-flavin reductase [Nonomuraea spiralis]
MRLVIFGATGGTGRELVRQALDLGHEVTAVVRDPARLPADLRDRVETVTADVADPQAIAPAIKGRDAVLIALGSRDRGPTTVHTTSMRSITQAMERVSARRLLLVSAAGLVTDAGDGPFTRYVLKPLVVQPLFKNSYTDLAAAERLLRARDLDWTIVRPARLLNSGLTGRYRTAVDLNVRGGRSTTRADLAHCMLRLAGDPASIGHVVSVAT